MANSSGTGNSPRDVAKGIVFLLVGVLLAAASIAGVISERGFLRDSVAARGVVVRQNHGPSHVQIEFTTSPGEKISYAQGGWISYEAGDRVRVLYYPANPGAYATVDTFGALWSASTMLGVMGLIFLVVGWVLIKGRRSGSKH